MFIQHPSALNETASAEHKAPEASIYLRQTDYKFTEVGEKKKKKITESTRGKKSAITNILRDKVIITILRVHRDTSYLSTLPITQIHFPILTIKLPRNLLFLERVFKDMKY